MNRGPSFKYLFILSAITIVALFLRYREGSLGTYAYVLGGIAVLIFGFAFRRWWRDSKTHFQQVVGPENELQCLEEMARHYAQGKEYASRQYIERCFDEFERANTQPSVTVQERLDRARRDFA